MKLHVERWGDTGQRVVCVHGSLSAGVAAFSELRALQDGWQFVVPCRRGYGDNPPIDCVDVDVDAGDVVDLIGDGAHVVGTSMGGIVSMRAAARVPTKVLSLTLIEPPAFPVAADIPVVREVADALRRFYAAPPDGVAPFCDGFLSALGLEMQLPVPYPPPLDRAVRNVMTERPWRLDVPIGLLDDAAFPKLVVCGDWSPAFEGIARRLAALLRAEFRVFNGAGHAVQKIGQVFNDALADFLRGAETTAGASS